jgi:hypothetical protein
MVSMVKRLSCALVLLCAVFQARAAVITFDTLPGAIENDTYNGFVGSTVDGVFYLLVCNDYDHTTGAPSGPWAFHVSTLPTPTFARFGNDAAAVVRYEQAALLVAGDGKTLAGLENVTSADDITAYQYALWNLFGAGVDDVNNASALLLTASNDLSNGTDYSSTFASLRIYTPTESDSDNQEFLGLAGDSTTTSNVPEPGSSLLFGTGLVVLATAFLKGRCYAEAALDN